jgi:hypothetical protein
MRSAEDLDVVRDKGRRLEFEIRELKRGIDGCCAASAVEATTALRAVC